MINKSDIPWRLIFYIFISLRLITVIASVVGYFQLPFKPSFPYWETILSPFGHTLIWAWANFDGVHYIMLAKDGYAYGLTQAFFPGYFILIRIINVVLNNYLLSGLFISHVSFVLMLGMLYKLLRIDYSDKIARRVLILISLFPTSFYFLSLYTESLFLLILVSMFYWLRTGSLQRVGFAGIGLTLTRIVGIFALPSFILELKSKGEKLGIKEMFWIMLPVLGLFSYMTYLWIEFKDPLLFVHVQSGFGAGRDTGKLVLIYQVIWRYIKMIITVDKSNPIYFTIWLELIASMYGLGLLILAYIKKVRPSYLLFSFLSFLLPTLTGTFSSMPRYVLILFPIFIVLALINNKYIRYFILTTHLILLFICTMLFTRGYWIS